MKTMMKTMIAMGALALFTACGGSGGGGSGGSPSTSSGSATYENLSAGSSSNQCVKNNAPFSDYAVPSNQTACVNAGGTWNNSSGSSTEYCRLGGVNYTLIGGGSADSTDITACSNAGGTFVPSTSVDQSYCSGHTPLTCSGAGGTTIVLDSFTGDINQSTVNLAVGSNTISSDSSLTFLVHGSYDGMNATEYPVYFSVVSKIVYLGNDFWTATITKPTSTSFAGYFGYNTDTPSFTVSLPVGTSANVTMETATLYTGR